MSSTLKPKNGRRTRVGTLFMLAVLLIGSAALRLGFEAGPAIAREVASLPEADLPSGDEVVQHESGPSSVEFQHMLAAFQQREEALAAREAEIEDRVKAMELANQAITLKLAALEAAEVKLEETLALADGATENDLFRLTAVYEQMKPKQAAPLFEEMDPGFAAGFLARMKPEAAAGIMAGLSPQVAYTISVVLAGRNGSVPKE
ncbi:MotE family protein [Parasedimentitalea maritima]|uniref:Flagellar motility protein MotE, a chaperone for MotC folding n=1 Tax=Parasedimentitalea maritima TaxID=2578117 RepID=A0A6A4RHS0_9RHOB|nr:hypothetical protein [Zongyanglinia marina]KAE9630793.1 hypothetical protein GP644_06085 [Zongyanglinia marina]